MTFDKLYPEPNEINDPWYQDWTAWLVSDSIKLLPNLVNTVLYIATIAMSFYYVDNINTSTFTHSSFDEVNMVIFSVFNSLDIAYSIMKFFLIMLNLEMMFEFDDETVEWLSDHHMYIWGVDQRLELMIEGYADLVKVGLMSFNFFVFSQIPNVLDIITADSEM